MIPERDFPVSHALLEHDRLMTHELIRYFGPVHAVQADIAYDGDSVTRWSTLHQTTTGAALLRAKLVIQRPNLPEGVFAQLVSGHRLFGALLLDAGVAVRMTDRTIYQAGTGDGPGDVAWGRRQRMVRAQDSALICEVDECLSSESTLRSLLVAGLPEV